MDREVVREQGGVLVEAAMVLPILIFLVVGLIDLSTILYNRYTAQAALIEGLRLASTEDALKQDLWSLDLGKQADAQKYLAFQRARARVIDGAKVLMDTNFLGGTSLAPVVPVDLHGSAGTSAEDAQLDLAYLPPATSAYVPSLKLEIGNAYLCTPNSGSGTITESANSNTKVSGRGCKRPDVSATPPPQAATELVAFLEVPTRIFGKFKTTVRAARYLDAGGDGSGPNTTNVNTTTNTTNTNDVVNNTTTTVNNNTNSEQLNTLMQIVDGATYESYRFHLGSSSFGYSAHNQVGNVNSYLEGKVRWRNGKLETRIVGYSRWEGASGFGTWNNDMLPNSMSKVTAMFCDTGWVKGYALANNTVCRGGDMFRYSLTEVRFMPAEAGKVMPHMVGTLYSAVGGLGNRCMSYPMDAETPEPTTCP